MSAGGVMRGDRGHAPPASWGAQSTGAGAGAGGRCDNSHGGTGRRHGVQRGARGGGVSRGVGGRGGGRWRGGGGVPGKYLKQQHLDSTGEDQASRPARHRVGRRVWWCRRAASPCVGDGQWRRAASAFRWWRTGSARTERRRRHEHRRTGTGGGLARAGQSGGREPRCQGGSTGRGGLHDLGAVHSGSLPAWPPPQTQHETPAVVARLRGPPRRTRAQRQTRE